MIISDKNMDAVKEIVHIGMQKANDVLSQMLDTEIELSVTCINVDKGHRVNPIKKGDKAIVEMNFDGSFSGKAAIAFTKKNADSAIGIICGQDPSEITDEVYSDYFREFGNVVLSNLVGSIGNVFKRKLNCDVPTIASTLPETESANKTLLSAETIFSLDLHDIEGHFYLIFEVQTMNSFLDAIDVSDFAQHLINYRILRDKAVKEIKKRQSTEEKLSDEMREYEAFAGRVAHDLKSPLGAIITLSTVLTDADCSPAETKEISEKIATTGHKLMDIVNGLYQLSGFGGEKIKLKRARLEDLAVSVMDNLKLVIKETNTTINLDCPHRIRCSHEVFPQVIQNLIANSIKFTTNLRDPQINISSRDDGDYINLIIEDNGPGIPEEKRKVIFGAFERLHGEEIEGLGLGLSMVKKIVQMHNAHIDVEESETLGGCKFIIRLKGRQLETVSNASIF